MYAESSLHHTHKDTDKHTRTHIYTEALKQPILLCWTTTSEDDDIIAVEVKY